MNFENIGNRGVVWLDLWDGDGERGVPQKLLVGKLYSMPYDQLKSVRALNP